MKETNIKHREHNTYTDTERERIGRGSGRETETERYIKNR